MDAILPTIVGLTLAALPVPLGVACVRVIQRRRKVLEENFVAGAVARGIGVQGELGAWVCHLEHRGAQLVAEPWSYTRRPRSRRG